MFKSNKKVYEFQIDFEFSDESTPNVRPQYHLEYTAGSSVKGKTRVKESQFEGTKVKWSDTVRFLATVSKDKKFVFTLRETRRGEKERVVFKEETDIAEWLLKGSKVVRHVELTGVPDRPWAAFSMHLDVRAKDNASEDELRNVRSTVMVDKDALSAIHAQIAEAESSVSPASEASSTTQEEIETLNRKIADMTANMTKMQSELQHYQNVSTEHVALNASYVAEIGQLRQQLKNAEIAQSQQPTAPPQPTISKEEVEALTKEKAAAIEEIEKLKQQLEDERTSLRAANNDLLAEMEKYRNESEKKIKMMKMEQEDMEEQISTLKTQLEDRNRQVHVLNSTSGEGGITKNTAAIREAEELIRKQTDQIEKLMAQLNSRKQKIAELNTQREERELKFKAILLEKDNEIVKEQQEGIRLQGVIADKEKVIRGMKDEILGLEKEKQDIIFSKNQLIDTITKLKSEIARKQDNISKLETDINKLRSELEMHTASTERASAYSSKWCNAYLVAKEQIAKLNESITTLTMDVEKLTEQNDELETTVEKLQREKIEVESKRNALQMEVERLKADTEKLSQTEAQLQAMSIANGLLSEELEKAHSDTGEQLLQIAKLTAELKGLTTEKTAAQAKNLELQEQLLDAEFASKTVTPKSAGSTETPNTEAESEPRSVELKTGQIVIMEDDWTALKAKLTATIQLEANIGELKTKIQSLAAENEVLLKSKTDLEESLSTQKKKLESIAEELKSALAERDDLLKTIHEYNNSDLKFEICDLNLVIADKDFEILKLNRELLATREDIRKVQNDAIVLKQNNDIMNENLAELKRLISEDNAVAAKLHESINQLEDEKAALNVELRKQQRQISDTMQSLDDANTMLNDTLFDAAHLRKTCDQLRAEIAHLREELEKAQNQAPVIIQGRNPGALLSPPRNTAIGALAAGGPFAALSSVIRPANTYNDPMEYTKWAVLSIVRYFSDSFDRDMMSETRGIDNISDDLSHRLMMRFKKLGDSNERPAVLQLVNSRLGAAFSELLSFGFITRFQLFGSRHPWDFVSAAGARSHEVFQICPLFEAISTVNEVFDRKKTAFTSDRTLKTVKLQALVRYGLNERQLLTYAQIMVRDTDLLEQYYEPTAPIRQPENQKLLSLLFAQLSRLPFALEVESSLEVNRTH